MQLSKKQEEAYCLLKHSGVDVFQTKDLCLLLHLSHMGAYNLLKALKSKQVIQKYGTFYAFSDVNELVIAAAIHFPSYLSFWTALAYYGWSDQLPRTIYLSTTKYTPLQGYFQYITLSKKRFFGYVSLGGIIIAEKEKAILDSLLFPKYAGGIAEIQACLIKALLSLNKAKLLRYALQMESKALLRRLGYLSEKLNMDKAWLNKLKKYKGKGYELLDPALPRTNKYNKDWLLDVNV